MSILFFIGILAFLIIIHELGHFVVAKICKVHIQEFGIGLPPALLTLFTWRGIPFTLNWILLGGFVRMEGEDGTEVSSKDAAMHRPAGTHPFYTRPLWQKLAVVAAGPAVNFAFGVVVFATLFSWYGIPTQVLDVPVLGNVVHGSPAEQAGLQQGNQIQRIGLSDETLLKVSTNQDLISFINSHRGQTLHVEVMQGADTKQVSVYARNVEETPQGQGATGIELRSQYEVVQYPLWQRPFRGMVAGLKQSMEFGTTILSSLGGIGRTVAAGKVPTDVSGPVGIAAQVQKEGVLSAGLSSAFNFAALLSINLAVMNILPIPALDGGRIVLLLVEKLVRKQQFQLVSGWLNTAGFVFLIGLLLLITLKDVFSILL